MDKEGWTDARAVLQHYWYGLRVKGGSKDWFVLAHVWVLCDSIWRSRVCHLWFCPKTVPQPLEWFSGRTFEVDNSIQDLGDLLWPLPATKYVPRGSSKPQILYSILPYFTLYNRYPSHSTLGIWILALRSKSKVKRVVCGITVNSKKGRTTIPHTVQIM